MNDLKQIFLFLWNHRTKVLGLTQVTLGVFATADGVFSPHTLKLIILGSGLATAYVGFFNSKKPAPAPEQ
jgi:hypothetical protein